MLGALFGNPTGIPARSGALVGARQDPAEFLRIVWEQMEAP